MPLIKYGDLSSQVAALCRRGVYEITLGEQELVHGFANLPPGLSQDDIIVVCDAKELFLSALARYSTPSAIRQAAAAGYMFEGS